MNLRTFASESITASADAGDIQSVEEKNCEDPTYVVPNYAEEDLVNLIHGMQDVEIKSNQDDETGLTEKHSINQPGGTDEGRTPNSWGQAINSKGTIGVDSKPPQSNDSWGSWEPSCKVPSTISPPLQTNFEVKISNIHPYEESIALCVPEVDKFPQDCDASVDLNDELVVDIEDDKSDGVDSDDSQSNHDIRKKNKWLRPFFESLDSLSLDQINEHTRQWHCPACQDGPGSIDWFIGLQSLMTHAKTKGRVRMRLHRELAEVLEEELRRRGISFIQPGEAFGKWKGLHQTTTDHVIVWPPMVVVMNTRLEKDENDKWKGMGNQELLEYFNTYEALKARHSYGPKGHRGMSVLIFEASAMGYLEAERLHKHFLSEGRDRYSWESNPVLFYPGGKRQLYGFLASKEDLVIFNRHSHGKAGLKFDIRSYQEMVVGPMKQMSNDNQKLIWLKNKVMQHEQRSKALEETFGVMDYQERFFKDQMDKIPVTEENGRIFKTSSLTNSKQADVSPGNIRDLNHRKVKTESFIAGPLKNVEEFEVEREKLVQLHEENKIELKQKHLTEETELEKNFELQVTKLMEKYSSTTFEIRAPDRRRIPVRQDPAWDTAGVIDTLNRLVDKMDRMEVYTRMRHQHIAGMYLIDHENLRKLYLGMGLPIEQFEEYPPSPFDAEGYLIEHSVDPNEAGDDAQADEGAEEEGDGDDDEE